jgi:hypothetical protein
MVDYEVQCVSVDYDAPYDDCRSIEAIGFEAVGGGFVRKTPDEVYRLLEDEGHSVHVTYHDERSEVRPATDGDERYVRSEPEDTAEDVLLKQPSC